MECIKLFNVFVSALLLMAAVFFARKSILSYLDANIALSVKRVALDKQELPAVTVCIQPKIKLIFGTHSTNAHEMYMDILEETEKWIHNAFLLLGLKRHERVTMHESIHGRGGRCLTLRAMDLVGDGGNDIFSISLKIPEEVIETGVDSGLQNFILVSVHEPSSFYYRVPDEFLDQKLVHLQPGKEIFLPIESVISTRLSTPQQPCNEKATTLSFKQCLGDAVDHLSGCQLPWRPKKEGFPPCNLTMAKSMLMPGSVASVLNVHSVGKMSKLSGCLPPCTIKHYKHLSTTPQPTLSSNFTTLNIYFNTNIEEHENEFLAYDTFSLVGEMGGFFGLFLGLSFHQIITDAAEAIMKYWKREK